MPLVGVNCADPKHEGEQYSFDECLACNRSGEPRRCNAMYALINAMANNKNERKNAGLSVTTLLNLCPRQTLLMQEHDYHESPLDYWPRFRGTVGHLLMETYDTGGPNIIQEVRFRKSIEVDGESIEITGKMDHVDLDRKLIIDYKSCNSVNVKPINEGIAKQGHAEQVSLYRWLLWGGVNMDTGEIAYHEIEHAGIHYFDMKQPVKIGIPNTPQEGVQHFMTPDESDVFIRERVRPLIHYKKTGELPELLMDSSGRRSFLCNYCPVRKYCDLRNE